jgi:uncharacterized membrane protein (DUF373 family)
MCVKALAVMMVLVIIWGVIDVILTIYQSVSTEPMGLLNSHDFLLILGAFISVLIAIEIFANVIIYLKEDSVHLKLVLATALIAISRKVIILDYKELSPSYVYATGAVILAVALSYWLIVNKKEHALKPPAEEVKDIRS